MTRVLPEPAPASTNCGPSPWVTAAICSGLRWRSRSALAYLLTQGVWPTAGAMARDRRAARRRQAVAVGRAAGIRHPVRGVVYYPGGGLRPAGAPAWRRR